MVTRNDLLHFKWQLLSSFRFALVWEGRKGERRFFSSSSLAICSFSLRKRCSAKSSFEGKGEKWQGLVVVVVYIENEGRQGHMGLRTYVQLEGRVRDGDEGRKEGVRLLLIANTMYCCTAV